MTFRRSITRCLLALTPMRLMILRSGRVSLARKTAAILAKRTVVLAWVPVASNSPLGQVPIRISVCTAPRTFSIAAFKANFDQPMSCCPSGSSQKLVEPRAESGQYSPTSGLIDDAVPRPADGKLAKEAPMKLSLIALCLAVAPTLASADESWNSSQYGTIVYEADIGNYAVFSMGGGDVRLYLEGLAGRYENAGTYNGYWVSNLAGACDYSITGADGRSSNNWGNLQLTFDSNAPARSYTVSLSICNNAFTEQFYATPQY